MTTGDTLCDLKKTIILEKMTFPEPVISVAVEPKTKSDQEKMGIALGRLAKRTLLLELIQKMKNQNYHFWYGRTPFRSASR